MNKVAAKSKSTTPNTSRRAYSGMSPSQWRTLRDASRAAAAIARAIGADEIALTHKQIIETAEARLASLAPKPTPKRAKRRVIRTRRQVRR